MSDFKERTVGQSGAGALYAVREANAGDIQALVELRIAFLTEDSGGLAPAEAQALRACLADYFRRNIGRMCFAFLVEADGAPIAAAYLAVSEKPANRSFPTGRVGTLLNVYTVPAHRRRGLATRLLTLLIERAKAERLSRLELLATASGKPLYEKMGFTETKYTHTPMVMRLS